MAFDKFGNFVPNNTPMQQNSQRAILPDGPPDGGNQMQNYRPVGNMMNNITQTNRPTQTNNVVNQPLSSFANKFNPNYSMNMVNPSMSRYQPTPQYPQQIDLSNGVVAKPYVGQYQIPQQQFQPQYMPPQNSLEQMVNNGNAQSVQNFLSALNKVGAGTNNTFQNQLGAQGQGAQAGFQGFGFNGTPQQPPQQNAGFNPQTQNYINNVNNAAYQGNYGNAATRRTTGGDIVPGTAGAAGMPNYSYQAWQPSEAWADQQRLQTGKAGTPIFQGDNKQTPGGSSDAHLLGPVAASDKNAKKNIETSEDELSDFLDKLGVYSYEYKDEKYGEGRRISPMAQEIESSKLGKDAIIENEEGVKMVDYGKLAGTQLAGLALLNKRYNEMNKRIEKALNDKFSKRGK